jgi:SPP1 gp7 family putative phage head morphogenesis protein
MWPAYSPHFSMVRDAIAGTDYAAEISALVEQASAELFAEFPNERLRRLALQYANRTQAFPARPARQADHGRRWGSICSRRSRGCKTPWAICQRQRVADQVDPAAVFPADRAAAGAGRALRPDVKELADEVQDRYGVSESRAQLIARDQIGKLYGNVHEARQRDLGLKAYFWRTAQDERVREEHAAREGERFSGRRRRTTGTRASRSSAVAGRSRTSQT